MIKGIALINIKNNGVVYAPETEISIEKEVYQKNKEYIQFLSEEMKEDVGIDINNLTEDMFKALKSDEMKQVLTDNKIEFSTNATKEEMTNLIIEIGLLKEGE